MLTEKGEGATLPAVLQIKQGGSVNNKYATSSEVAGANNGAANDPYQLNLLPPSSEGGNILVADEGKTIEQTIERIKNEAISEVTPDPYAEIVAGGLAVNASYAILKDDLTFCGYDMPLTSVDIDCVFVLLKDIKIDFSFNMNSTITVDFNGHTWDLTSDRGNNSGLCLVGSKSILKNSKGNGKCIVPNIDMMGNSTMIIES